jgi:hypothetical protein
LNCPRCGHPHTQDEWDELFFDWKLFFVKRRGFSDQRAFDAAHREMRKHGPRPKVAKPPLWLKIGAKLAGEGDNFMKLWEWLNGKKTFIGTVLVGVPVVWNAVQPILEASGASPEKVAAIGGILLAGIGIAHKVLKAFGIALPKAPENIIK